MNENPNNPGNRDNNERPMSQDRTYDAGAAAQSAIFPKGVFVIRPVRNAARKPPATAPYSIRPPPASCAER